MTKESQSTNPGGSDADKEPFVRSGLIDKVLTESDRRRILRERARMLAQKEEDEAIDYGETLYVFEFILNKETYAFDTRFVREVLSAKNVANMPCTPRFVAGVVNVRGEIVTVLDTKSLFALDSQGLQSDNKLIILNNGSTNMSFLVDQVVGIRDIQRHSLQPPLSTMQAQQARYVAGMTSDPLILIDVEALMNDPGIVVEEEVE
jgi:purine-binding chemotaxis protein CheW